MRFQVIFVFVIYGINQLVIALPSPKSVNEGCCRMDSAECNACVAGTTVEEYCNLHPKAHGCPTGCKLTGTWNPAGHGDNLENVEPGKEVTFPGFGRGIGVMNTDNTVTWTWLNSESVHTGTFSDDCITITWENDAKWIRVPSQVKMSNCRNVCHKDGCKGTLTNPIPLGHQWITQKEDNKKGCCAFGLGSCDLCCPPVDMRCGSFGFLCGIVEEPTR